MPQLLSLRSRAHKSQLLKPAHLEPVLPTREVTTMRSLRTAGKSGPRLPQLEKAHTQQQRRNAAKNKNKFKKNTVTEMKNTLEVINRINEAKEQISELVDRVVEITAAKQNKEKKWKEKRIV